MARQSLTGVKRVIALDEGVLTALQVHRERQRDDRTKGRDDEHAGLVIATHSGLPVSARNLDRAFKRALTAAALPPMPFHDLRHTHGSLLVEGGADARVVADRMGHSQISFTMQVYVHARTERQRSAAEALGQKIMGPRKA